MNDDPIDIFTKWFEVAKNDKRIADATAMTLATADKNAVPSARIVLLKGYDKNGFVFYTNLGSKKSLELKENPNACLCFYWQPLGKQVRIYGKAKLVSDADADIYYESRPFLSRLGAWASNQSETLDERATLVKKLDELQKIYSEETPPPRPPHWSGWLIKPNAIEFWNDGEFRLHDRELYERDGADWKVRKLYP
ncbi:MAG: pyridoxamine 5'-phosphate oxidase [Pseudomonadota bacterium]